MSDLPKRIGQATLDGRRLLLGTYDERVVSLSDGLDGIDSGLTLIERWEELTPRLEELGASGPEVDLGEAAWAAPVMPRKLICVGANYRDHLDEMERSGAPKVGDLPFPFSFLKPPTTAVVGSEAPVAIPAFGTKLDWEAELAVVIGRPELAESDPLNAVFGYTIVNDLSFRDFVAPFPHPLGLDALICKGWDGAAPLGPWITLAAVVGDPQSMSIELRVNGTVRQKSSTQQMIFTVEELVSYYGRILTLEPGDVIATGTPAGVAAGMESPRYLEDGDTVEIEIGDLGLQRTPLVASRRPSKLDIH